MAKQPLEELGFGVGATDDVGGEGTKESGGGGRKRWGWGGAKGKGRDHVDGGSDADEREKLRKQKPSSAGAHVGGMRYVEAGKKAAAEMGARQRR